MITIITTKTSTGYYGQVLISSEVGPIVRHTTPHYLTQHMAMADAACWNVFHPAKDTYTACGSCGKVEVNEGPWNADVTWCVECTEAGKHLPEVLESTQYDVCDGDTVWYRGNKMTGAEFATWLNKVHARNADKKIEYGVEAFRDTDKGFHLRIRIGTMPERVFRVIKK